jgi:hypothetical protein
LIENGEAVNLSEIEQEEFDQQNASAYVKNVNLKCEENNFGDLDCLHRHFYTHNVCLCWFGDGEYDEAKHTAEECDCCDTKTYEQTDDGLIPEESTETCDHVANIVDKRVKWANRPHPSANCELALLANNEKTPNYGPMDQQRTQCLVSRVEFKSLAHHSDWSKPTGTYIPTVEMVLQSYNKHLSQVQANMDIKYFDTRPQTPPNAPEYDEPAGGVTGTQYTFDTANRKYLAAPGYNIPEIRLAVNGNTF